MAGTLFVVATPIGNLDDVSSRALRVLRDVSIVAAEDTRHTAHLLHRFGITTPTTSLHEHNERGKTEALVDRLRAGESVALVSDAGTPTVSDPGQHLVARAHEAGIAVVPVPGPSAVIAALAASGIASDTFTFLGFPPNKGPDRRLWLDGIRSIARLVPTVVLYEAPHRVRRTLQDLHSQLGDIPITIGRELTKVHEQVQRTSLAACLEAIIDVPERGEYTLVLDCRGLSDATGAVAPDAAAAALEFRELTETSGLTRRQAISSLSRKYGLPAREVYHLLEQAKGSGR